MYTHKLFKNTYAPVEVQGGGVLFKVAETGEERFLTNHQIEKLLVLK